MINIVVFYLFIPVLKLNKAQAIMRMFIYLFIYKLQKE